MQIGKELSYIYFYKLSDGKFICVDYGKSEAFNMMSDIMTGNISPHSEKIREGEYNATLTVYDETENTATNVELRYPDDVIDRYHFLYGGDIIYCPNYYIMRKEEFIILSRKEEGFKNFTDFQLWYFLNNIDLRGLLFYLKIHPVFVHDNSNDLTFLSSRKIGHNFEILIPDYCNHGYYQSDIKPCAINTSLEFKSLEDEQTIILKPYKEYEGKNNIYHFDLSVSPSAGNKFVKTERIDCNMCIEMKFSEFAELLKNDSRSMMLQTVQKGVVGA